MFERIKKARENEGGFTLVELLIVIVILGILAAVVVFSVTGIKDRGEASACKATKAALLTGFEASYAQDGTYPATVAALQTAGFVNTNGTTVAGNVVTDKPTPNNKWTLTFTVTQSVAGPPYVAGNVAVVSGGIC